MVALACLFCCGLAGRAVAAVPAWTTYHHDPSRSGIDPDSTGPVVPSQAWQTAALDGRIYGEPLVYGADVYVATENDSVYALDSATGAVVWRRHLGPPVPASVLPCGDIRPTVGITSTPVIDSTTGRIYVVGDAWDGSHTSTISHWLMALNLSSGRVAVGPERVDPPNPPAGDAPAYQLQRASLALDGGRVIIGYGGNSGDCGPYHGWLVSVPETGGALEAFEADSHGTDEQGAIWGSGNAPAVDSSGDLWISTGNGDSATFDFSESVIRLDPNMNVLDWWAPTNWLSLDQSDLDIGSSEPLLLPGGLVFEIGKEGTGYLLSASHLGAAVGAPLWENLVCVGGGSYGGGIYYNGVVFVPCVDGMHALSLNTAPPSLTPVPGWAVDPQAVGPPIEAGGLIWSTDWHGTDLYGLDPSTGAQSFDSGNLNGFEHFATPSAGGGSLFVADRDASTGGDHVTAFRLTPAPPAPVSSPTGPTGPTSSTAPIPASPASAPALGRQLSHVHVAVVHRRLRIKLTLSEAATLTVVISRLVPGRLAGRRCRLHARRGRRCLAGRPWATLNLRGRTGMNRFVPRMRALAPGRYRVTVNARDAGGRRSKPQTVVVVVRR